MQSVSHRFSTYYYSATAIVNRHIETKVPRLIRIGAVEQDFYSNTIRFMLTVSGAAQELHRHRLRMVFQDMTPSINA